MNQKTRLFTRCLALTAAATAWAAALPAHGQGATATISDVPAAGGYDYTIVLDNTGATDLNAFWYGWTTDGNNLPSTPGNLGNTLGWGELVFGGHSIEWANSSGSALAPGDTGTFTFFSPDSPATITAAPAGESVAYVNGIEFNEDMPGASSPVFSPTLVAAPEPAPLALCAAGLLGWLAMASRKAGWS